MLRKATGSLSMEKSEERCARSSEAGMDEAVLFSEYQFFLFDWGGKKGFLPPVLSPINLDWGVLSKCLLNLIQIYLAVFQIFPFLYLFEGWNRLPGAI